MRSTVPKYLQPLLTEDELAPDCRREARSLAGRLAKDKFLRADGAKQPELAAESLAWYTAAYELTGDVYPGINAATMALMSGQHDKARHLAESVRDATQAVRRERQDDYWLHATLGEACLIVGLAEEALDAYTTAARLAAKRGGDRNPPRIMPGHALGCD